MDEDLTWFYFDAKEKEETKQTKGPYNLRDLDVLIRTGVLNSGNIKLIQTNQKGSLIFKTGMADWEVLFDIPVLKNIIQEQSMEIFALQTKIFEKSIENNNHISPLIKTMSSEKVVEPIVEQVVNPAIDEITKFEQEIEEIQENPLNDEEKKEIIRKKLEKNKKKTEKEKEKKKQQWYNPRINTNIYVSGLPPDITDDQMVEFFGRAGVIRINQQTLKPAVKLYKSEDGKCKGDGLISYKMIESVQIAKDVLNEKDIIIGFPIRIEDAHFEQKGDYKKRDSKRLDKLQKEIAKQKEKNMMAWDEEKGVENHGLKIVILKNMFTKEQSTSETFMKDLEVDVKREIEESVGEIVKLEMFSEHKDGIKCIIKVKFVNAYDADQCISIMNERYFDTRQISCFYWDGKTDYKREAAKESLHDQDSRLDEFGRWLEEQETEKDENATVKKQTKLNPKINSKEADDPQK